MYMFLVHTSLSGRSGKYHPSPRVLGASSHRRVYRYVKLCECNTFDFFRLLSPLRPSPAFALCRLCYLTSVYFSATCDTAVALRLIVLRDMSNSLQPGQTIAYHSIF